MYSKSIIITIIILSIFSIFTFIYTYFRIFRDNFKLTDNVYVLYEGLLTEPLNKDPQLESSGLGDRILRWQASIALARTLNKKIIIPIVESDGNNNASMSIESISKILKFPKDVKLIKHKNLENFKTYSKIYLREKNMFKSAENFWNSVPDKFKKLISKNKYENIIKTVQFLPKLNKSRNFKYIVLHIRQGDVSFDCNTIIKNILNELKQINNCPIYIMSDSIQHKNEVSKLFELNNLILVDKTYFDEPDLYNYKDQLSEDYSNMYYSKGIISISKRGYSALPYSVSSQTGIPLLFFPNNSVIDPNNGGHPSKNLAKSFLEFKRLVE